MAHGLRKQEQNTLEDGIMNMNRMKIRSILCLIIILFTLSQISFADNSDSALERHIRDHFSRVLKPEPAKTTLTADILNLRKDFAGEEITISESVAPARFKQDYSDVARLSDGRMVACWEDNRNGSRMIFAQILGTDGEPSGSNWLVAEGDGVSDLIEPKAVSDGAGGFYIVWRELATGQITALRYDSSLNPVAGPFAVNNISDGSYAGCFDIAALNNGRLIAVWEDYNSENNIALRTFTTSGSPLFNAIHVNTDAALIQNWEPAVALDTISSTIAVVWEGYAAGANPTIYMQYVNINGSLVGTNFTPVAAGAVTSPQILPEIEFNSLDKFIMTWLDARSGTFRVYLQRAGRTAGLIGVNTPVSADNGNSLYDQGLASEEGSFTVSWSAAIDGGLYAVLMQRFDNGAVPDGSIATVYSSIDGFRENVALEYDNTGDLHTLWTDNELNSEEIYFQRFGPDGTPLRAEISALNDEPRGAHSTETAIAVIDDSRMVTVFRDRRNDDGDVFLQFVNSDGALVGTNVKLNDDVIDYRQEQPSVAVAPDGSFLAAAWTGYTAPGGVFGQHGYLEIDPLTEPFVTTTEFLIDDSPDFDAPAIAVSGTDKIFTVYGNTLLIDVNLYGKIYNSDGSLAADRFVIDNDIYSQYEIDCDNNDIFTVSYLLNPTGISSAEFVRYDDSGTELGRFGTTGGVSGVLMNAKTTAVGATGIIYLLWRGDDDNLYLTSLDINGAVLESSFLVNDDPTARPEQIRLAVGTNGSLIASWIDHREGRPIMYYQVYEPNLSPVSGNLPATDTPVNFMQDPAVAGNNTDIWLAWSDAREFGLNIHARTADYVPTDIADDDPANLPDRFALEQNYPNPFNPTTVIEFSLPSRSEIELNVYDILGRKVRTLATGSYEAGTHSITWDALDGSGKKVASGVYFYLLKTGNRHEARKMILLK